MLKLAKSANIHIRAGISKIKSTTAMNEKEKKDKRKEIFFVIEEIESKRLTFCHKKQQRKKAEVREIKM